VWKPKEKKELGIKPIPSQANQAKKQVVVNLNLLRLRGFNIAPKIKYKDTWPSFTSFCNGQSHFQCGEDNLRIYLNNTMRGLPKIAVVVTIIAVHQLLQTEKAIAETTTTRLEGGINHKVELAPGLASLKPGSDFSIDFLRPQPNDSWVKIPQWLAGTWRSLNVLRTFRYDEKSGQTDNSSQIIQKTSREIFGLQQDSAGDIWTLSINPNPTLGQERTLEGSEGTPGQLTAIDSYAISKNDYQQTGTDRATISSSAEEIRVDKATNKIVSIETQKVIRKFSLLEDGLVSCLCDQTSFEKDGTPASKQKFVIILRRIEPFKNQDDLNAIKLKSSFEKYLDKTGQLNLKNGH
jgi:hypothetical protein